MSDCDIDSGGKGHCSTSCYEGLRIAKNQKQMINNPDYSDVFFICKDGVRVSGCRLVLAAHNDFFRSMFLGGMRDSRHSEIPLPEIFSTGLLHVIDKLYTGCLCSPEHCGLCKRNHGGLRTSRKDDAFPIKDWRSICDTMVAAKFFLIKDLSDRAWSDLKYSARLYKASGKHYGPSSYMYRADDDIQAIIKAFSVVAEYDPDKVFHSISRFFPEILVFTPLKPEHLHACSNRRIISRLSPISADSKVNELPTFGNSSSQSKREL